MHDPQKFKNSRECFLKECPFCRSVQHWLLKETVENLKAANKCWLMFGRSLKSKISAFLKNASSNACYKMPIHDVTRGNGHIKINFRFGKNHYKSDLEMYGQLSGLNHELPIQMSPNVANIRFRSNPLLTLGHKGMDVLDCTKRSQLKIWNSFSRWVVSCAEKKLQAIPTRWTNSKVFP